MTRDERIDSPLKNLRQPLLLREQKTRIKQQTIRNLKLTYTIN
jgi:hypothetical protein